MFARKDTKSKVKSEKHWHDLFHKAQRQAKHRKVCPKLEIKALFQMNQSSYATKWM